MESIEIPYQIWIMVIGDLTAKPKIPTIDDIFKARDLFDDSIRKTPLQRSDTFSKLIGTNVFLKLESLQMTGSFKVRGAYVKLNTLTDENRKKGVIAAICRQSCTGSSICHIKKRRIMSYRDAQKRITC